MPHSFPCDAEFLLRLIETVCEFHWDQKARVKKVSHLVGGHFPIFLDGKPMRDDMEDFIPSIEQRFNELLDDIYKDVSPDIAVCGFVSYRWRMAAQIILLGKEQGLSRADWGKALNRRV
jgi:hypothetical protein